MRTEVEHLVNLRVPEEVRSVKKKTMEVKAQFSQLSEHALVLTEENSALRERSSQLSVDVGNLEQMLKDVSRQSCIHKKVIVSVQLLYQNLAPLSGTYHPSILKPILLISPMEQSLHLRLCFLYPLPFPFASSTYFLCFRPSSSSRMNISEGSMNWKTVGTNSSSWRPNTQTSWLRWRHTGRFLLFLISRGGLKQFSLFVSFVLFCLSRNSSSQTSANSRNTSHSALRCPTSKTVAKPWWPCSVSVWRNA